MSIFNESVNSRPFTPKGLRIPPQDVAAEQALLGSILIKPEGIYEAMEILEADDFYAEKHRRIYKAMLELRDKNEPIDAVSLTSKLKEHEELEAVGGASYLAGLINSVPTAANLGHYGVIVKKKSFLRKLIHSADHISSLGYNEAEELDDLFDRAQKAIYDIGHFSKKSFVRLKDTLVEAWERFDKLHKSDGDLRGLPTGFKDLDNKLAGLQRSDLIILAARPSMGKTSLALDIARNAACQFNKSVGIFSLEMSSQQLVDRLLASESRVDSWHLRTGKLKKDEDFSRLRDALDRLSTAPIFIDDEPSNTITKMRSVARKLKAENGLDLIVVDYLQLMIPKKDSDSLVQQVTEISRSLKGLARELEVPVLALSQLNRSVEQRGGKPRLSDLRDSGCLTGDTLIFRADTGERCAIKDLVGKQNVPILSLDSEYRLRPMLASRVFSSGRKPVFALTSRSGRVIKASGNHPFLTLDGWQRLDVLQTGDRLALPRRLISTTPKAIFRPGELILLAHDKRLPARIFSASDNDIRLFLHHLWATDGNISWKHLAGRKSAAAIYYSSASQQLARDVQHLLLRLGIWSTMRKVPQGKHRPAYQVHVQSVPVQLAFLEQVGSFGARGQIVPKLISALKLIVPNPNSDTIPSEIWKLLVEPEKERVGASWRNLASACNIAYNGNALFVSGLSRTRLKTVATALQSDRLLHLAESDVYWDEITTITPLGMEEVYDLTVPGTHNFVANDVLVHNSIEQDADVVLFIHREDKQNENSERKNIADLIIAKHRNGPTGEIQLYFDEARVSFNSIEKSDFGGF